MKYLVIVAAAFGGILLFLLASASANTALFASHYPWLLGLNAIVALALLGLVGWQLRTLWREHRAKVFGSRLKLRLMLLFGLMAVVPGALVYSVSVQFLTKSIETWFDVRVEKALESGLDLGRSALDYLLVDLTDKGRSMALELGDHVGRGEAVVGQGNHGVKPQVGHLIHQRRGCGAVIHVLGGHDHLCGLLANLLQEGIGPFVQQARDIAGLRVAAIGALAALDHGGQAGEGVSAGHGLYL